MNYGQSPPPPQAPPGSQQGYGNGGYYRQPRQPPHYQGNQGQYYQQPMQPRQDNQQHGYPYPPPQYPPQEQQYPYPVNYNSQYQNNYVDYQQPQYQNRFYQQQQQQQLPPAQSPQIEMPPPYPQPPQLPQEPPHPHKQLQIIRPHQRKDYQNNYQGDTNRNAHDYNNNTYGNNRRGNNNNTNNNRNSGHFVGGGGKLLNFSKSEISTCDPCNALTSCFHGFHKYFGDKEFFKLLNSRINNHPEVASKKEGGEEEKENSDDDDDGEESVQEEEDEDESNPNSKTDKMIKHMFGVVCEMLEFYYSDEDSHIFEHSETTQERMTVHALCHFFGFVSTSVGFHPKRRVHVAKIAPGSRQEIQEITVNKLRSLARDALRNTKTISSLEKRDSNRRRRSSNPLKDRASKEKNNNSESESEEDEEEKGKNDGEEENGSPKKKRPRMVHQTQTGLEEPLNLDELKERIRIQIDQELQLIATGSELIEKLNNIEREISENYSVPSFEHLRHGSFISFLNSNKDIIGNISVGTAKNAGESAQDPLLSRIPSPEELRDYVEQYIAHHDTKAVDKIVHSVLAQFDIPVKCFKDIYAKIDSILKSESTLSSSKRMKRQYLRAYLNESSFENWTPEKAVELPFDTCVPPLLNALTWGRVSKRQNISSIDASVAFDGSDLVFLDGGVVVKRTEGKNLCHAITVCDPWAAVSEIVSLILGNDGKLPIELCSQQCMSGFSAIKLDPYRFLLDFLKLLPSVFYETMDGTIKSAILDPFVDVFGRLDTMFFASITDNGDKAYVKYALSLLGVDVTGFVDRPEVKMAQQAFNSTLGTSSADVPEPVEVSRVKKEVIQEEKDYAEPLDIHNSRPSDNSPECVIEDIRRYEFGIGVKTDERTQKTLKAQYEREARAIERLSSELYTRDSHFFLELLQNADDNSYPTEPGFCPTLELEFTPKALIVRNNEIGFSERDVRAICDIANSTKSSSKRAEVGQTGEKGIGFKAVFRVSDKPQIHSNGYHFEFDSESEPVKFIVPRWIGDNEDLPQQERGTEILLPWRKDIAHKVGILFNHVTSMNAESLLFLRRLSKVVVKNTASNEERTISREIKPVSPESGASLVHIRVGPTDESTWLIVERKLSPQVVRKGISVNQTALSLGFRLTEEQGAYAEEFCSVCALLPLCPSKFRFIIQGDFVSSASREGLDEDVAWNQWLRSEVPDTFIHAVKTVFLTSSTNLRYTWYAFVPMLRDETGLFGSVPAEILRKLSSFECVITEDGNYTTPKKALLVPEAARKLFPQSAVDTAFDLSLRYCHTKITSSAGVLQLLGVQSFGVSHLVTLLSKLSKIPIAKDDAWFHDLFKFLCDYAEPIILKDSEAETAFYDGLKTACFIPTEGPSFKLEDPSSVFLMKQDEEDHNEDVDMENNNNSTEEDSKMVRFSVLRSFDPVLKSKVVALLQKLGVRTYSEHEHLLKHIIPALPEIENESVILAKTLIVYKHWKSCSICLSDSRSLSRKLYNGLPVLLSKNASSADKKKFCFLKDACVHFRPRFQEETAACNLWNVLSDVYPSQWHDFFVFVGVRDSLCVYPEQQIISLEGDATTWHNVALPPALGNSYRVDDFVSPEFDFLVKGMKNLPPSDACNAMEQLVRICEDDWLVLSKFVSAKLHYHDPLTGNELSLDVPSSFAIDLRTKKWIPSGKRTPDESDKQKPRFRAPSALFIDKPECAEYTGEIGPYPKVSMSDSFAKEIGVRFSVTPDDALALLQHWAKTNKTKQTNKQMESIYKKAAESSAPKNSSDQLIFDLKEKRYVSPSQAFWDDPSESFVSLIDVGYAPEMREVFVNNFGVRMYPDPDVYIRMLEDLTGTPGEGASKAAFGVFAHFGRLIEEGVLKSTDHRWRKLGSKVIFPTTSFHWVSVKDHIYINDIKSSSSYPSVKGLFFMYLPSGHRLLTQGISFASILGVKRLSDVLSLRTITDDLEPDNELLEFIRNNIVYIQRFIKKRYPDIYASFDEEFTSSLAEFRVFTASRISGVWCVDNDREMNPIPYKVLLCGCSLYYRRSNTIYRYDKIIFDELSKFFLGKTRDTTIMSAFLDMLAHDNENDNETLSDKMEEYIGPELEDNEKKWEIPSDESDKIVTDSLDAEDIPMPNDSKEENGCGIQVIKSSSSSDPATSSSITEEPYSVNGAPTQELKAVGLDAQNAVGGRSLNTLDDEEKRKIGDRGEKIVFDILKREYPHDTVSWCNENEETGLPYDLVVSDANGSNKRFIEVKATKTTDKSFFEVSFREWMFSQEHRGKFYIYRVFDALGDGPKVLKIQNPFKEWNAGNLGMLLYIKDKNGNQT